MFSATNATVEAGRARRSRDMLGGDALHEVSLVMVMRIDATIVTLPRRSRHECISFMSGGLITNKGISNRVENSVGTA